MTAVIRLAEAVLHAVGIPVSMDRWGRRKEDLPDIMMRSSMRWSLMAGGEGD
jgi:hypothetical protein